MQNFRIISTAGSFKSAKDIGQVIGKCVDLDTMYYPMNFWANQDMQIHWKFELSYLVKTMGLSLESFDSIQSSLIGLTANHIGDELNVARLHRRRQQIRCAENEATTTSKKTGAKDRWLVLLKFCIILGHWLTALLSKANQLAFHRNWQAPNNQQTDRHWAPTTSSTAPYRCVRLFHYAMHVNNEAAQQSYWLDKKSIENVLEGAYLLWHRPLRQLNAFDRNWYWVGVSMRHCCERHWLGCLSTNYITFAYQNRKTGLSWRSNGFRENSSSAISTIQCFFIFSSWRKWTIRVINSNKNDVK